MTTSDPHASSQNAATTENPILGETELQRWSVSASRPVPKANSRLVFIDNKGHVIAPEQPMTLSEIVWGGLRRMYEVDTREHRARFHAQVPCREKGFSFDIDCELSWRVVDPAQIVKDGRTDVAAVYRSYLIDRVSEESEQYGLERRLAAEQALKRALDEEIILSKGIKLRKCALTLSLGAEAEAHFKSRTLNTFETETLDIQHAGAIEKARRDKDELAARDEIEVLKGRLRAQHQRRQLEEEQQISTLQNELDQQKAQYQRELERQRQLAEAKAQLEVAELKRQLERQQTEHQLALEGEREQAALRIKLERMDHYKKALESGGAKSLIPIFLDERPGDVGQVLNLIVDQHRDDRENARKILEAMLEAGVVNGRDLDHTRRAALQKLLEGLTTNALGSSIDDSKPPAIEPTVEKSDDVENNDEESEA